MFGQRCKYRAEYATEMRITRSHNRADAPRICSRRQISVNARCARNGERLRRARSSNFIYLGDQYTSMGNPNDGQVGVFRNRVIFNVNPAGGTAQTSDAVRGPAWTCAVYARTCSYSRASAYSCNRRKYFFTSTFDCRFSFASFSRTRSNRQSDSVVTRDARLCIVILRFTIHRERATCRDCSVRVNCRQIAVELSVMKEWNGTVFKKYLNVHLMQHRMDDESRNNTVISLEEEDKFEYPSAGIY